MPLSSELITDVVSGRRIVEPALIAARLKKGCDVCHTPLQWADCVKEKRCGLASVFCVRCKCGFVNDVASSKSHQGPCSGTSSKVSDVNSKAAVGMLNAGIGPAQFNTVVSAMNIPPVCPKTLKRREREMGPVIESLAKRSCTCAAKEELEQTTAGVEGGCESNVGIAVSYDMGWQKRGTGKSYNSTSGVGHMFGAKTKKVVGVCTFTKRCATCERARKKGEEAPKHDCRCNWTGSAKAMEPAAAVSIVNDLQKEGVDVGKLIGDDDATTLSHLRRDVNPNLEKVSDVNHVKKNLGNHLYALRDAGHKEMSVKTIKHVQTCFNYAVMQNKGSPGEMQAALQAVVPHLYDDHSQCVNQSWCHHKDDPTRKYKSLPRGKPLTDKKCKEKLMELFAGYARNANRLAASGSTQQNENLNQVITTKHPKNKHYGGSESLSYRVSAAVCQTNEGHGFVSDVMRAAELSPGSHTVAHGARNDCRKERDRQRRSSKAYRAQRRLLKDMRGSMDQVQEVREGPTYGTECGSKDLQEEDISCIPGPSAIKLVPASSGLPVVVFDLETTSLERNSSITQLAASLILQHNDTNQKSEFSAYALPWKNISGAASKVTGLMVVNGKLLRLGREVPSSPIKDVLKSFFAWLKSLAVGPVLLASHNCFQFDFPVLLNEVRRSGLMDEFRPLVAGVADTLPAFRDHAKGKVKQFNVSSLTKAFMGPDSAFDAHNATQDVAALSQLVVLHLPLNVLFKHSRSLDSAMAKLDGDARAKLAAEGLRAQFGSAVSAGMIQKIASSGLSYTHLQLLYKRGGGDGVKAALKEKVPETGKPRVTTNGKILAAIVEHLSH